VDRGYTRSSIVLSQPPNESGESLHSQATKSPEMQGVLCLDSVSILAYCTALPELGDMFMDGQARDSQMTTLQTLFSELGGIRSLPREMCSESTVVV